MGTTAQKLQAIANSKAAIKAAIEAKGVSDVGNKLSDYATKIGQISGGGSSGDPRYEVNSQGQLVKKNFALNYFNDVTSIPDNCLNYAYYRSNVTSVSFPNLTSVETNGLNYAFRACTSLTSVDLSSLTSVGQSGLDQAFYECTSLTSVDLSSLSSVEKNGLSNAFFGCFSLTTVYLSKLSSVGQNGLSNAFRRCKHLELVDFSKATSVPALSSTSAFDNTNNYYRIVVPDALYNQWIAATNWSDPSIVTHIEKAVKGLVFTANAANSTISLDAVGNPPSLDLEYSTDGGRTFQPYTVGTTITLSNVNDKVLFRAGSTGQTALADDSSNYHKFTMTGSISIKDDISYLLNKNAVPSTTALADYAFYGLFNGCTALQNAPELPWTTIGEDCYGEMFKGCTSLTTVDLSKVTSVGNQGLYQAFRDCTSLTTVDLSSLTSVGNYGLNLAFYGCTSLTSVDLSNLTSVGSNGMYQAFALCTSLTSVDLSRLSSVGWVGLGNAFQGCTHLELVDFSKATAVPALSNISAFQNTNDTFKIVVPDALYDSWIVAKNWSTYASHIVKASEYTPSV